MRKSRKARSDRPGPGAGQGVPRALRRGDWVWACRYGFEAVLRDELSRGGTPAWILTEGLVGSGAAAQKPPVFARAGFEVAQVLPPDASAIAGLWPTRVFFQAWVPDSPAGNLLSAAAAQLEAAVVGERARTGLPLSASAEAARAEGVLLAQAVLGVGDTAIVGAVPAREAIALAPGGRSRMHRDPNSPSRAAMKVDEALEWLGLSPGRGEVCVDLGAAPGGWTERLLAKGARVIAVDPAKLRPDLMRHPKLTHAQQSAFGFTPPEPVDWLFCDMAWRPLEVAQLLGRWARQGWALHLVANVKLPMKDKLPIVERVLSTLTEAGWKTVRARQLYHDRDEITLLARSR